MQNRHLTVLALTALTGLGTFASASPQRRPPRPADAAGKPSAPAILEVPGEAGIAWFGSWDAGLAEARRTDRPILLMSATPQCQGVPGMW